MIFIFYSASDSKDLCFVTKRIVSVSTKMYKLVSNIGQGQSLTKKNSLQNTKQI